jgi:hypothetical protein
MAKKSISDIVLRAVVDTSGVAAGLNNIGSQVSGRSFGQSGGGPTGASGAAGGFVNPHGGGAGAGAAAVAAAAAAGVTVARARGGRLTELAANPGAVPPAAFAAMNRAIAIRGNPITNALFNRFQQPLFSKANALYDAANMAREAGSRTASDLYVRQAGVLRERFNRRNAALAGFAQSRIGRMAGGAIGGLGGMGDRIGAFTQRTLDRGGPLGGLTRFAGLMGMGRFAGVGGFGLAAGAPVAAAAMAYGGYQSRYNSSQDITRFNFGADRQTAMAQRRFWRQGVGNKAPLDLSDRFWLGAYRENNNQAPWMDKLLMASGGVGGMAEATGARMASWGTMTGILKEVTLYNTVDSLVQFGRRLFN